MNKIKPVSAFELSRCALPSDDFITGSGRPTRAGCDAGHVVVDGRHRRAARLLLRPVPAMDAPLQPVDHVQFSTDFDSVLRLGDAARLPFYGLILAL